VATAASELVSGASCAPAAVTAAASRSVASASKARALVALRLPVVAVGDESRTTGGLQTSDGLDS
jgi:hypothetical protein